MAKEHRYHHWSLNRDTVKVCGSFRPNGSSAVSSTYFKGNGWSVARAGTGLFTITFSEKWPELICAIASVREAAGAPTYVQFGDYVAASKTLQLRIMQEAAGTTAAADLASDADNVVNFECTFAMSSDAATY